MTDVRAFDQFEAAGWEVVAAVYERVWSPITSQAVDALLDAAGVGTGMRVLDVGSGAGDTAARATERGARATGVDVAAAMVEIATRRHPGTAFVEASVTELPFADESFDAAVGNIVIQHVGDPELAARELERVLAEGGHVALSTWDAPERSPFFGALLAAIADAHVPPPTEVPPGPSFFQFADDGAFQSLLRGAGFAQVSVETTAVEFPLESADDLIGALADGTVRTGALLRAADDAQRGAIRESLETRLEEWRRGDAYLIPAPVKIARGRKLDREP
ncbi:MAG TPA: methyltransferase domain-containing protein [Thermoleophilaceae bacterium]|jgi:SAM-dependent methyltransferase